MEDRAIDNLFKQFIKAIPKWHSLIEESFLPLELQETYHDKIDQMVKRIS